MPLYPPAGAGGGGGGATALIDLTDVSIDGDEEDSAPLVADGAGGWVAGSVPNNTDPPAPSVVSGDGSGDEAHSSVSVFTEIMNGASITKAMEAGDILRMAFNGTISTSANSSLQLRFMVDGVAQKGIVQAVNGATDTMVNYVRYFIAPSADDYTVKLEAKSAGANLSVANGSVFSWQFSVIVYPAG